MAHSSARRPLALSLAVGVVTVALVASTVIGNLYEGAVERSGEEALRGAGELFTTIEQADVRKMEAALERLLADPELIRRFTARDRPRLLAAARPRFEELRARFGTTHLYFIDLERKVFLRAHRPELHGDLVERLTLAQAAESGQLGAGLELGQTAFALRVVRPWVVDGKRIGYLELAEEIDHFLVEIRHQTGLEMALVVKKAFLDQATWARVTEPARNTWDARPDVVVVDTTTFTEGLTDFQEDIERMPDAGLVLGEREHGGKTWLRGVFPVRDAAQRKVGALSLLMDFTQSHGLMVAGRRRVLLVVLGMSAVACLVVWGALEQFVFRRLRAAAERAERRGGLEPAAGDDELARLERATGGAAPGASRDAP
jgi:hypothetical protein